MADIDITKMSSKGQIVIPLNMRADLKEGEKFVIMKSKKQIILQKVNDFSKTIEEDLEFAKRTNEAWKRYEKGEFVEMEYDKFLKEVETW